MKQKGENKELKRHRIEDKIIKKIDQEKRKQCVLTGIERYRLKYREYFRRVSVLN